MKHWYESKTMWFNVAVTAGAVVSGVLPLLITIQPFLTPVGYSAVFMATSIVNIVLRTVTKDGLHSVQSS